MKTYLYARVVAKPISFPDVVEILYQSLDEQNRLTGENFVGNRCTWDEAQHRFSINVESVKECESYLQKGELAFLGNWAITGKFYDKGELFLVPPA
jgi:hypothetical protein